MKTDNKKPMKWWQWILAIGLLPITLTLLIWQKKDWSQNKKLKFIAGIWIFFIAFGAYQELRSTPAPREVIGQRVSESSQSKEEEKPEEKSFTEEEALKKIKRYEVTTTLMGVTEKRTLEFHYAFLANLDKQNKDLGWTAEKESDDSYIITHSMQSGSVIGEAKWRVSKDSLEAINGVASAITPELVRETAGTADQEIYDSFNANLGNLMDTKQSSTTAQIDAIYEEAYRLTAKEYKITTDEAKQAITRSQKANAIR